MTWSLGEELRKLPVHWSNSPTSLPNSHLRVQFQWIYWICYSGYIPTDGDWNNGDPHEFIPTAPQDPNYGSQLGHLRPDPDTSHSIVELRNRDIIIGLFHFPGLHGAHIFRWCWKTWTVLCACFVWSQCEIWIMEETQISSITTSYWHMLAIHIYI